MRVDRLYSVDRLWVKILRLWSRVTVFEELDSDRGRELNLERLKEFRTEVDKVINELETEQEMESWLD